MPAQYRVKIANSKYVPQITGGYQERWSRGLWIPEEAVKAWRACAGSSKACARAAELAEIVGWIETTAMPKGPAPKAAQARVDKELARLEAASLSANLKGGRTESRARQIWQAILPAKRQEAELKYLGVVEKWVGCPAVMAEEAGRAGMFERDEASELARLLSDVAELSSLIPAAVKDAARAQGVKGVPDWARSIQKAFERFARAGGGAEIELFDSDVEFSDSQGVAVYVSGPGQGERGFVDANGKLSMKLSDAMVFPSEKAASRAAKRAARHGASSVKYVKVTTAMLSYESAAGGGFPDDDLDRALSGRTRRELEASLREARLEQLEAELARRRARMGECEAPKKRSARL